LIFIVIAVQKPEIGYLYLGGFLPQLPERPCVSEYKDDCELGLGKYLKDPKYQKKLPFLRMSDIRKNK
jgi:hypothetical protein